MNSCYNKQLQMIIVHLLAFIVASCKTSNPVAKISDTNSSVAEVVSISDTRSPMYSQKSDPEVVSSEKKFQKELNKNGKNVAALVGMAQVHLAKNDIAKAEEYAKKALRFDQKNRSAKKVMAACAVRNEKYELAEIIINSFGAQKSKDSFLLNLRAMIADERGQNQEALSLWKDAIRSDSTDLASRMNLGVLYLKYRQLSEASIQFERVLKIMPDHLDARMHLAIIKGVRGQNSAAEKTLKEVLSEDKENPLALYNLAVVQRRQAKYDDAITNLKTYLKTKQARARDNDEVFAMIDSIQNEKISKGQISNEDEAQAMAAKLKDSEERSNDPSKPKESVSKEANNSGSVAPNVESTDNADLRALEQELKK